MDNGMESMLDMYLFETNTLLEQLDEILIEAEKEDTFTSDNVNEIFRSMHTIKGSSAMMEFNSLMTIAHRIEDLFFYIRENGMDALTDEHKKELFDLVFRSTDYLRSEISKVESNEPLSTDVDTFVAEINTFIKKINQDTAGGSPETNTSDDSAAAVSEADLSFLPQDEYSHFIQVFFDESAGMENLRAFMLTNSLKELDLEFHTHPDNVESDPTTSSVIVENGFFIALRNESELNQAIQAIKNDGNVRSYEIMIRPGAPQEKDEIMINDQEEIITDIHTDDIAAEAAPIQKKSAQKKPAAPAAPVQKTPVSNKQSLISVNLSKLDSLMAIVGEIVITESMVTSSPELQGLKLDSFLKSSRQLRKLTDDLQDIAMSLRMVPISGTFQKMNRIVRDMRQKLGKDVRLTLIGEDTEVDKSIVDSIGDPIMHIVRNSMDHGIEEHVEDRLNAGKPAQGEIVLSARNTGSEVVISIQDDGAGVNPESVLAKAKRNGILTKPENEYTRKEILGLLMAPGFSTNETVTEYSGRGVGMDVVRKNVEAVGGIVTISSEEGQGMTTTLKIPLTLSIMDGMEVKVGNSFFTIPISNIRQSFKVNENEVVHDSNDGEIIERMDAFYPIVRIYDLYNIEEAITNIEDGILVWVEAGDKSFCLFVDELLGEQPVVVKPLPSFLNNFNIQHSGISGCTILGDGNISIILDMPQLYEASHI